MGDDGGRVDSSMAGEDPFEVLSGDAERQVAHVDRLVVARSA